MVRLEVPLTNPLQVMYKLPLSPDAIQDTPCCDKLYITDISLIIELIHIIRIYDTPSCTDRTGNYCWYDLNVFTSFCHTKHFFLIHSKFYHSFASQCYFFCISAWNSVWNGGKMIRHIGISLFLFMIIAGVFRRLFYVSRVITYRYYGAFQLVYL